jgi:hypothetical protein
MNAGRSDADAFGEVAVAERVVATRLRQFLRGVEELLRGTERFG